MMFFLSPSIIEEELYSELFSAALSRSSSTYALFREKRRWLGGSGRLVVARCARLERKGEEDVRRSISMERNYILA